MVGTGAYGQVRYATDKTKNKNVRAIKIVNKKKMQKHPVYINLIQDEIKMLKEIDHPCIMKVYELLHTVENYYVVTELVKGGDLFERIT